MNNETLEKYFPHPFAAFAETCLLADLSNDENFLPVYASSNIKVLPYQIAAARFALRSQYLKGCILCDEGSLGKTYEALLIIAQKCYEGKGNILIVLPQNLINQWKHKIETEFTLPFSLWHERDEENLKKMQEFYQNEKIDEISYMRNCPKNRHLFIATYDEVLQDSEEIEKINWDLVVFDEADVLFKPENKTVKTLKKAVGEAFKLLLTPTPITLSIMDIYGLIHFIDETVLPDSEEFYNRYFRKPERYPELSQWVSQFSFRTLKSQVAQYVGFSHRLPFMGYYELSDEEKELNQLIELYLALPAKQAYPEMDQYRLTLMFYHMVSSSPQALAAMLDAPISRVGGQEQELLITIKNKASALTANSKINKLLEIVKKVFAHLKKQKENQKAIVFVESVITLDGVYNALKDNGYNVINSKDENALEQFRSDENVQIFVTTDTAAKGLDIEYCPVVVNYDLLYNALEMEQRICRCHRQGQKSDVLVINMFCKTNIFDVRVLELINKRTLQFGGIFGMSDDIVGNFDLSLDEVLEKRRLPEVVQNDIKTTLEINRTENEKIVEEAETALFTTFTKEIASKITVSPNYIQEKSEQLCQELWQTVVYFMLKQFPDTFDVDEDKKIISLKQGKESPLLFYYNNRAYYSNKKYGLASNFKPETCRITPTSILATGVFSDIRCYDEGLITVDESIEPCEISLYSVELRTRKEKNTSRSPWAKRGTYLNTYNVLHGMTQSGRIMTQDECRKILNLSAIAYEEQGQEIIYWSDANKNSRMVQKNDTIESDIISKYLSERKNSLKEDTTLLQIKAERQKARLESSLDDLRSDLKDRTNKLGKATDLLQELKIKKEINTIEHDLKQKENDLFFEKAKIDIATEDEIADITDEKNLYCEFYQLFKVKIITTNLK